MIDDRLQKFFSDVSVEFRFLEIDFGFTRRSLERRDFEHARDASAIVPYVGRLVGIQVIWGLGEAVISVCLYELEDGEFPEKYSFYKANTVARAIHLDSLVRFLSDGEVGSPLPEITPDLSVAEMIRRGERRARMINADMRGVLSEFANRLKEFGSDVLRGDTSVFSDVQAHHERFWRQEKCW